MFSYKRINLKEANETIAAYHRHSKPVQGYKFAIAVSFNDVLQAVLVVGRPVARMLDNGFNLEITRICCVAGAAHNTVSFGIGAIKRELKSITNRQGLPYSKLYTYILETERGASLKAANMVHTWTTEPRYKPSRAWSNREGRDFQAIASIPKKRFELELKPEKVAKKGKAQNIF